MVSQVTYSDGDVEELNLKKERFKIIEDKSSASEVKISYILSFTILYIYQNFNVSGFPNKI